MSRLPNTEWGPVVAASPTLKHQLIATREHYRYVLTFDQRERPFGDSVFLRSFYWSRDINDATIFDGTQKAFSQWIADIFFLQFGVRCRIQYCSDFLSRNKDPYNAIFTVELSSTSATETLSLDTPFEASGLKCFESIKELGAEEDLIVLEAEQKVEELPKVEQYPSQADPLTQNRLENSEERLEVYRQSLFDSSSPVLLSDSLKNLDTNSESQDVQR